MHSETSTLGVKKITAQEIRQKYLSFMESKGHKIVPSSSLIPENDPTTLFTGSGMQPMVPYLLWEKHPLGTRICDSQKSFRSGDIDDIWDNRHTTFFEMLWNWSLWDYFKKEQIEWIFEFYIKELWLDPKRVYVSVYRGNSEVGIAQDDEAVALWQEQFKSVWLEAKAVNMAEEKWTQWGKIFYYNEKENWWSRAGVPENMPVGEPGGPDSEMFWDFGEHLGLHEKWLEERKKSWKYREQDEHCHPACDCGRFLEFANNVFMQFKKTDSWFEELAHKNIDFGGGLERIVVALNDDPDVFLWDVFDSIRTKIEELSGKKYGENEKETKAFRVIMDHLRAATFLISDWAFPSNKDQWYFTRRLLRRAIRFARDLWIHWGLSAKVAEVVIAEYAHHYTELLEKKDMIISEIEAEEKQFLFTLEKGLKEFEKLISPSAQLHPTPLLRGEGIAQEISWKEAFKLYDTYGFPLEMTLELAEEKWLQVDVEWFNMAFEEHKNLSRAGSEQKFKWGLADASEATTALHSATHLMLAGLRKYLWEHVHQKWSNITAERLRFDFNNEEKVSDEILKKVEDYVNEALSSWLQITMTEMPKQEALESWVEWSFWEKYPEVVKVYSMFWENWVVYSRELCWWPHIENSENIWKFRIVKEEASSRGVRRIKAVLEK